jgi:hypothetical protein
MVWYGTVVNLNSPLVHCDKSRGSTRATLATHVATHTVPYQTIAFHNSLGLGITTFILSYNPYKYQKHDLLYLPASP